MNENFIHMQQLPHTLFYGYNKDFKIDDFENVMRFMCAPFLCFLIVALNLL